MYRILVTISLFLVAGSSAYMSIYGLRSMFFTHSVVIVCMGLGMEIGKVLTVSYLYMYWKYLNRMSRFLYILIVSVLAFITSIEIIGFLSQCHISGSQDLHITEVAHRSLKNEAEILTQQISVIDQTLDGLPTSHVSRRIKERKAAGYDKKQTRLLEIIKNQSHLEAKLLKKRQTAGPVFALAHMMKIKETDLAAKFILLLVLVLEPLSIGLTLATSAAWSKSVTARETKINKTDTPGNKNCTNELRSLCSKYNLTIAQIADITGRKKLRTCEEWINGQSQVPERALRAVKTWVRKHNPETSVNRKIVTVAGQ